MRSAQSGESSNAVFSSPFVSASEIVVRVCEKAALIAATEVEIVEIAPGISVRLDTPLAVSWIELISVSSVVESESIASFAS